MLTADDVRARALGFPEVVEADHHGRPSFRVRGRIIATLWSAGELNVMAGEARIRDAVAGVPEVCRPVVWGRALAAVRVDLSAADAALVEDLLDHAWRRAAPARLRRAVSAAGIEAALEALGLGDDDRVAWGASGLGPDRFDTWVTDRLARRPHGATAVRVYGADDAHDFARRSVLSQLALGPGDRLLEIGCGGGLLLRDALASGSDATGLDHSPTMVALARERAPGATVAEGDAAALPFGDGAFTAVAMVMVFLFFDTPDAVLAECRRVLVPGGRLAIYTPGPALRGTPALPDPVAACSRTYDADEIAALVADAGFADVVVQPDGGAQLVTARGDELGSARE